MRVLLDYTRRYPWRSALTLLLLLASAGAEGVSLGALVPLLAFSQPGADERMNRLSRGLLDALQHLGIQPDLGPLIAVVALGMTARAGLDFTAYRFVGYTIANIATDLRLALVRALLAVRWPYFHSQPVGRFVNAMSSEADRASKTYFQGAKFVAIAVQLVVYAIVALFVSWKATLYYLASAGLIAVGLHRLVRVARRSGK